MMLHFMDANLIHNCVKQVAVSNRDKVRIHKYTLDQVISLAWSPLPSNLKTKF